MSFARKLTLDIIAQGKIVRIIVKLQFRDIVFPSMFRKVREGVVSPKTSVCNGAIPVI
jgi:hypothetical protein